MRNEPDRRAMVTLERLREQGREEWPIVMAVGMTIIAFPELWRGGAGG